MALSDETISKFEETFKDAGDTKLLTAFMFTVAKVFDEQGIVTQDEFFKRIVESGKEE